VASHLRIELVLSVLDMAVQWRRPGGTIHHSDQGSQYTALAFSQRCKDAGVCPSMGSVGDCYDNAMCESFFATLECELLDREGFAAREDARKAIFTFIEGCITCTTSIHPLITDPLWRTKRNTTRSAQRSAKSSVYILSRPKAVDCPRKRVNFTT
jgi:hypothetical protein